MADVVVTVKLMPTGVDADLDSVEKNAKAKIAAFTGIEEMKSSQEPVAFGIKSVNVTFVMDEDKGSTEALEKDLATIDGVDSVEVTDVRRAMG